MAEFKKLGFIQILGIPPVLTRARCDWFAFRQTVHFFVSEQGMILRYDSQRKGFITKYPTGRALFEIDGKNNNSCFTQSKCSSFHTEIDNSVASYIKSIRVIQD